MKMRKNVAMLVLFVYLLHSYIGQLTRLEVQRVVKVHRYMLLLMIGALARTTSLLFGCTDYEYNRIT